MRGRALPAVLGVLVVTLTGCHSGVDSPLAATRPTPTAAPDRGSSAASLVADRRSHLSSWKLDPAGDVLGVWSRGWGQYPRQAFEVRTSSGDVTVRGAPSATFVQAAVPHGWIVSTAGRHGTRLYRVGLDAVVRPLTMTHTTTRPRPGDVLVHDGVRMAVYRPSTRRAYDLPTPPVPRPSGGYVTASGSLVVVGSTRQHAVWATYDRHGWTSGTWQLGQSADAMAGAGDAVTVVLGRSLGNGVDATGVDGLALSHDGGRTWHTRRAPRGVVEALSSVMLPSGTTFVSTGSGQLLRLRPGHRIHVVPGIRPISLSSSGSRLYALVAASRRSTRPFLRVSTDGGHTWTARVRMGGWTWRG